MRERRRASTAQGFAARDAVIEGPAISDEVTQWSRVARVVYHVQQRYQYTYSAPVRELNHQFRVVPRAAHGDQQLLGHEVAVAGPTDDAAVAWDRDGFGNCVCTVQAGHIPEQVTFEASYRVERFGRFRTSAPRPEPDEPIDLAPFLEPTPLTMPNDALADAAESIRTSSPWQQGRAYRAFHWAAAAIVYRAGATNVSTTAAEALAGGAGVCQDYSHVLLTVLRLLGIPARYVSGHLLGEGAPHAWVEALFPDDSAPGGARVVGYDPTNRCEPGLRYIAVAVGRDFADVTPTSGWFVGRAEGRLSYSKRAEVVEVEYRDADLPTTERGRSGARW